MILVEAIDEYARELELNSSADSQSNRGSIGLLKQYLTTRTETPTQLSAAVLRDFVSRWWIERAVSNEESPAATLLKSLTSFLAWLNRGDATGAEAECTCLLEELSKTLPRAIEITAALSRHVGKRGGAFSFPEFLTTFADGGQSQYDIDVAGEGGGPGAIEGYFRIIRVEGSSVEVEEIISEERSWPLTLPDEIASLIEPGYIVNLEIIRNREVWLISACGFAYPPGTEM